jgi:hypothetical protein
MMIVAAMDPAAEATFTACWITMLIIGIFCLLLGIVMIVSLWNIFEKAGEPGFAALIPVWREMVIAKIAGYHPALGLSFFAGIVPCIGGLFALVMSVIFTLGIAKRFGKEGGFAVGLILLPLIFLPMLAFGDARYIGNQIDRRERKRLKLQQKQLRRRQEEYADED